MTTQLPHLDLDPAAPAPHGGPSRLTSRTGQVSGRSASSAVAPDRWAPFDAALIDAAEARRQQLSGLLEAGLDPIAIAQRDALEQTLKDIAAAQRRLVEGSYGTCVRCTLPVPVERLELRPWAATCVTC